MNGPVPHRLEYRNAVSLLLWSTWYDTDEVHVLGGFMPHTTVNFEESTTTQTYSYCMAIADILVLHGNRSPRSLFIGKLSSPGRYTNFV